MPANTSPIFPRTPDIQWSGAVTAANTAKDGTGTVLTVFTADATEGGTLDRIVAKALGTNVATVARFFVNNGSTNATAANNSLIGELSLPAITNSETAAQSDFTLPLRLNLPAGYSVNVVLGTAVASGWQFTAFGGKY